MSSADASPAPSRSPHPQALASPSSPTKSPLGGQADLHTVSSVGQTRPQSMPASSRIHLDGQALTPASSPVAPHSALRFSLPASSHAAATSPHDENALDLNQFLAQMRSPGAALVREEVRRFLRDASASPRSVDMQVAMVHNFLSAMNDLIAVTPPWSSQNKEQREEAGEAMEKFVMVRMHPYVFPPAQAASGRPAAVTGDLYRDAVVKRQMRLFSWVRERHLDLPLVPASAQYVRFAAKELRRINTFAAPRDKLITLLNVCKVAFGLLRRLPTDTSADSFLPLLILIILQSQCPHIVSNVEYIARFRAEKHLASEGGYYIASAQAAVTFIEAMKPTSLSHVTLEEQAAYDAACLNIQRGEQAPASPSSEAATIPHTPALREGASLVSPRSGFSALTAPLASPVSAQDTRDFLARTGEAARLSLGRPIGVLGRIWADATASDSDDDDGHDGTRQHALPQVHPDAHPDASHAGPHAKITAVLPSTIISERNGTFPRTTDTDTGQDPTNDTRTHVDGTTEEEGKAKHESAPNALGARPPVPQTPRIQDRFLSLLQEAGLVNSAPTSPAQRPTQLPERARTPRPAPSWLRSSQASCQALDKNQGGEQGRVNRPPLRVDRRAGQPIPPPQPLGLPEPIPAPNLPDMDSGPDPGTSAALTHQHVPAPHCRSSKQSTLSALFPELELLHIQDD